MKHTENNMKLGQFLLSVKNVINLNYMQVDILNMKNNNNNEYRRKTFITLTVTTPAVILN